MALIIDKRRRVEKYSDINGKTPLVQPSQDHTDGTWTPENIYKGELFLNLKNKTIWTSDGNEVFQIGGGISMNRYDNQASFPTTGTDDAIYIANDIDSAFYWDSDSSTYKPLNEGGGDVTFSDKDGNVKYTGNTDKRVGYHDTTNKIYYPNIIQHGSSNKIFTVKPDYVPPYISDPLGTNSVIALRMPKSDVGVSEEGIIAFEFTLITREGTASTEETIKAYVTAEVRANPSWIQHNKPTITVLTSQSEDNKYDFDFAIKDDELFLLIKPQNLNLSLFLLKVDDVFISNRFLSNTNPVVWSEKWETSIEVQTDFTSQHQVSFEDALPVAKKSKVDFADETGDVKYTSSTDKRTGYYDEDNEVYYPNIKESNIGVYDINFNTKDINFNIWGTTSSGGGTVVSVATGIAFEIPLNRQIYIQIEGFLSAGNSKKHSMDFSLDFWVFRSTSGYSFGNVKARGIFNEKELKNLKFYLAEYLFNGKLFIAMNEGLDPNGYINPSMFVSSLKVSNLPSNYDILDLYKSVELISKFNTNSASNFNIIETIENEDIIPFGKLDLEDAETDPSFTKNLVYNPTTKEYGYKSFSEKNPNFLVVDTNYSGDSSIGDFNKPFTNIKSACQAVKDFDPNSEIKFLFLLKTGTHTFDTLSNGAPFPKNIELYTESNTTLIIDSPCILNNSNFTFGLNSKLLFTNYGTFVFSENGNHYINCNEIGIHKVNTRSTVLPRYSILVNNNFDGNIEILSNNITIEIDNVEPKIDKRVFLDVLSGSKIRNFKLRTNTFDSTTVSGFNSQMIRNINNEYGSVDISVNTVICPDRSGRLVTTSHCTKHSGLFKITVSEVTCNGLSFAILETNGSINNINLHLSNARINGAVYLVWNYDYGSSISSDDFFGIEITGQAILNPFSGVNSYFESLFAQNSLTSASSGVKRAYIHLKGLKLEFIDNPSYGGFLFTTPNYESVSTTVFRLKYILEDCEIKTNNKELFRIFDITESSTRKAIEIPMIEFFGTNKIDVGTSTNLYRYETSFYWDKTKNFIVNHGNIYHNAVNENYNDGRAIINRQENFSHKLFDSKGISVTDVNSDSAFDKVIFHNVSTGDFGYKDSSSLGGGGSTDLSYTPSPTNGIISSSSGADATLPLADNVNAGLQKANFYEAVNFTPTIPIVQYDVISSQGRAIRIGNLVYFHMFLAIAQNGSPTSFNILGLPFPVILQARDKSIGMTIIGSNLTVAEIKQLYGNLASFSGNNVFIISRQNETTGVNQTISNLEFQPSGGTPQGQIYVSGTYITYGY